MFFQWTSSDGDVLLLDNLGEEYFWKEIDGLNSAEPGLITQQSPYQHGHTSLRNQYQARQITFKLLMVGITLADLNDKKSFVGRIFATSNKLDQTNIGVLAVTVDSVGYIDPAEYSIECTAMGSKFSPVRPYRGVYHQEATVYLQADDPRFLQTEKTVALPQGANVAVDNLGEMPVGPIIRIVGPANSPTLTNTIGGVTKSIGVTAPGFSGAFYLEFDFRFGKKSIMLVEIATGAMTDYMQYLTNTDTDVFWDLQVGAVNTVKFVSASGGTATIYYREMFQAIW